nr:hypothetical protein GCM10025730_09140 [Promicromonospora thailandica]
MTTPAPDPAVPDRAVPDPSWDRLDRRAAVLAAALYTAGPVVGGALLTAYWVAVGTSLGTALAWTVPPSVLAVAVGAGCGEWMWRVTRYHVDTDRLHVHTGVVFRKRLALRRERIRSVDLTADPVLRVLGVATVRVGTGEHAGAEGTVTLWPLRRDAADALRATLLAHAARPVPDAEPADGALARFDPRWIRYAPLSFVPPALGAAAAGGVIQVSEWFGRQDDLFAAVGSWFGLAPVLLVALALLAGLLLVGAVAALALWVETWWNHTLDREADGTLRVRRGLLTTRSISLEESRLRGIELVEPLGVRLAGAARVDAVATGLTTSEEDKSESRTLLPAAPKELADQVAAAVLREPAAPTAAPLAGHPRGARTPGALGAGPGARGGGRARDARPAAHAGAAARRVDQRARAGARRGGAGPRRLPRAGARAHRRLPRGSQRHGAALHRGAPTSRHRGLDRAAVGVPAPRRAGDGAGHHGGGHRRLRRP